MGYDLYNGYIVAHLMIIRHAKMWAHVGIATCQVLLMVVELKDLQRLSTPEQCGQLLKCHMSFIHVLDNVRLGQMLCVSACFKLLF